jgi:hypothetical protein
MSEMLTNLPRKGVFFLDFFDYSMLMMMMMILSIVSFYLNNKKK